MKRIVLTFGLISGAIISGMLLATLPFKDSMDFDTGAVIGYASMVAAGLMVYFGVRRYRDTVGGGRVGFGRALAVGMLIVVVSSALYTVTWEVMYFGFPSDFLERYQAQALAKERARGATEAELAATRAEMEAFARRYANPAFNAAVTFGEPLPVGLIVSLVSAGVLSRRRRQPEGSLAAA